MEQQVTKRGRYKTAQNYAENDMYSVGEMNQPLDYNNAVDPNYAPQQPQIDINAILAENERLKVNAADNDRRFAEMERRISEMTKSAPSEKTNTQTVTLYCGVDFAQGIVFSIEYEKGKYIIFDSFMQSKTISMETFETFASSSKGSEYLRRKWVLVGGKVPENIQRDWQIDYKTEELLNKKQLDNILDMPTNELEKLYKDLCRTHKEVIARRLVTAYNKQDKRVNRDKISALDAVDNSGILKGILKRMLEQEAQNM